MRHSLFLLACLASASLALTGCVDPSPGESDEDDVAEASEAVLGNSQIASYATSPVEVPNGKKIVVVNGVLHAAFRSGSLVQYSSSTDGATWSAPVTVDATSGGNPTIAVGSDDIVMIGYVGSPSSGVGSIRIARGVSGVFTPFAATSNADDDGSKTPSIVASGTTFHLSWSKGTSLKYVSFPSSQTSSLASAENVYTTAGTNTFQPAVLVGPKSGGGSIIRVAFIEDAVAPTRLNFITYERSGAGVWGQVYFDSGSYSTSRQVGSVSVDANPSTGDAYMVVSRTIDGVASTILVRDNTLVSGFDYNTHMLYASSAPLVSVAARTEGCVSKFRIVTSSPSTGHGAASFRTGTWTGGGAPTWLDAAPIALTGTDRTGTALLQSIQIPNSGSSRFFIGTYEERVGLTFRLRDEYDTVPTPAPCN